MKILNWITNKFESWLYNKREITIGELYLQNNPFDCTVYDCDMDTKKFISQSLPENTYVETPSGYSKIKKVLKTIRYDVWHVELVSGDYIMCADEHILIDTFGRKIYVKDLKPGNFIKTKNGTFEVKCAYKTNKSANMYDLELDDDSHVFYTNNILSHNTTTVAAFLLHYVLFNPDKSVAILANKGATSREILDRVKMMYEYLPLFLQPGVKEYNKGNVTFGNDSKIIAAATSSDSIRGRTFNCVYIDEMAFVQNADEFYESTYPVISSGKDTKVIITSTPNGLNLFYKLWIDAKHGRNAFVPIEVNWWEVPHYDEKWKEETIKNIGKRKFEQEYGNKFFGASGTLIDGETLERLTWEEPIEENDVVHIYEKPKKDHIYVATVDTSEGTEQDYSVITVIDITEEPYKQVMVYRNNKIQPLYFADEVYTIAKRYNDAWLLIETNSIGNQVSTILYHEYEHENMITTKVKNKENITTDGFGKSLDLGIRMTPASKKIGCSNLKVLVESDALKITDFDTIQELQSFIKTRKSYAAEPGKTDDIVMTLVMFGWLTSQSYFSELTDKTLRDILKERLEEVDLPGIGFFSDGTEDYTVSAEEIMLMKT